MKYKVTVVTTTYNQEKYIEQCLKGVLNQKTNFNFQFLISDDNSTDNTKKIIKQYKKKYPNIIKTIFRKQNIGPMDNFIKTLNEVHTEYVALCDGDDFWTDNNKLQRQVDFLDTHLEYNMCFHKVKIFFEDGSKEPVLHPVKMKSTPTFKQLLNENFITANSVVYRWKYKKNNSFINDFPKNIIPGDYYVHLMHASEGKIHYINKQMSCYRRNAQGMWYLTSQPHLKDKFYLKNGEKMLNFYAAVEKKLNLKKDVFLCVNKFLISETLNAYFINHKFKLLKSFYKQYFAIYSDIFINYFKSLNTKNKIIYVLNTDILYVLKKVGIQC